MISIRPDGITFDDVLLIPKKTNVLSRKDISLTTKLTARITLRTPIVSANMDTVTESTMAIAIAKLGGIGIIHRFLSIEDESAQVKEVKKQHLLVGAAIGIRDDYVERAEALIKAKADIIVIDIAHGHSEFLLSALRELKKQFKKTEFIAGNIATAQAAKDLISAGADGIKVGIGPGALCTTRVVAGAGVPQITALMDTCEVAHEKEIPVIADGGIRYSGDVVKALATGASTVMIGTLFAGCEESPAIPVVRNNQKFKLTRGMASLAANKDRNQKDGHIQRDLKTYAAEGVEALVKYKGPVADYVKQMLGGVKSGFSYCGAVNMKELWGKAEFIQISNSSLVESHPHDVNGV